MTSITPKQSLNRYKTLAPALQDILFSTQTAEIIRMVCEKNSVPKEKNSFIAGSVGLVLLGFIHPEDLAKEIEGSATLSPQIAASISSDLMSRLFVALKPDLDKAYAPLPHESEGNSPKIIQDIGPVRTSGSAVISTPPPVKIPPLVPAPRVISQTISGAATVGTTPLASNQSKAAPPPAAPKPAPAQTGWSRQTQEQPVVKLSQTSTPPPSPSVAEMGSRPTPSGPRPSAIPIASSIGEFARRAIQTGQAGQVTPKPPTPAPAGPAPVIIHEDPSYKAQSSPASPDFHLQLPTPKFDMQKNSGPVPVRPAVTEFGKLTPPALSPSGASSSPRVVHYTEYKGGPSVSVAPGSTPAPQGPRQVTELTSAPPIVPPPKPPESQMPPMPPKPPSPPAQPQTPQNKVARVDY